MSTRLLTSPEDLAAYDAWVRSHPEGTLWQSLAWKAYQEALGREVRIFTTTAAATRESLLQEKIIASALVVIDRTAFGLSTWEIPRGPLGPRMANGKLQMVNFLQEITKWAFSEKCFSAYCSPPVEIDISHFPFPIFHSARAVFPSATRIIDLTRTEEEILAQMHQKGRYNIRVAERHGVRTAISTGEEAQKALKTALPRFQETAKRDGFTALPEAHYSAFLKDLEGSFLVLAYAPDEKPAVRGPEGPSGPERESRNQKPIAALMGVMWNGTGIYYYGASSYEHRALMAPYLLQWEAMKLCKKRGCRTYDLLGVAPGEKGKVRSAKDEEKNTVLRTLPFALRTSHPWGGISEFKAKFGGTVVEYPPEQEVVLRPLVRGLLRVKRVLIG